jgi:cardiolipin synthase
LLSEYLPHITTLLAGLDVVVMALFIPWVLMTKKDASGAVAWSLVIILVPLMGAVLFWVFGYTHVNRPLRRVRRQRSAYRAQHPPRTQSASRGEEEEDEHPATYSNLGQVARRVHAFPITPGNSVALYHDTQEAFTALLDAIREARHHIHLEFFIVRSDITTDALVAVLAHKVREGVEVRLLYDAMGSVNLKSRSLRPLLDAGGTARAFLPLNPLRSRIQVNLRNHRKIAVVDGRVGFTGGMNIGDEYLGKDDYFGYWRDSFLRVAGPAVAGLQRVFAEDWDFACREPLNGDAYFPELPATGDAVVQVVESGPDQEIKSIREIYFAAILSAQKRLWIASPYFVPDSGILDALRLARYRGVDVRLLTVLKPDHYLAYFAARYYMTEMLEVGVQIFQYKRGMMHAKLMMVDGQWAMVGSANLDNRSLHLSFEAGCALYTPALVAELEEQFERDLKDSVRLEAKVFARRSYVSRLTENACRLLSPLL